MWCGARQVLCGVAGVPRDLPLLHSHLRDARLPRWASREVDAGGWCPVALPAWRHKTPALCQPGATRPTAVCQPGSTRALRYRCCPCFSFSSFLCCCCHSVVRAVACACGPCGVQVLTKICWNLVLAKHDPMQASLLHSMAGDKKLTEDLPRLKCVHRAFRSTAHAHARACLLACMHARAGVRDGQGWHVCVRGCLGFCPGCSSNTGVGIEGAVMC